MRALYLNNSGDKWIVVADKSDFDRCVNAYSPVNSWKLDRSPMDFMLALPDGTMKRRRADYYEQFGNFATVSFRLKGLRYGGFFESLERIDDLPVLRRYSRRYNKMQQSYIQSVLSAIKEGKELDETTTQNYAYLMQNQIIDTTKKEEI